MEPNDFRSLIAYFDLDDDKKLNFHDFMQIFLSCDDGYLRAAATQRPSHDCMPGQFLPCSVEKALSALIYTEVRFKLKLDQMKRDLESQYDFTFKKAFAAIDDWNYGFLD